MVNVLSICCLYVQTAATKFIMKYCYCYWAIFCRSTALHLVMAVLDKSTAALCWMCKSKEQQHKEGRWLVIAPTIAEWWQFELRMPSWSTTTKPQWNQSYHQLCSNYLSCHRPCNYIVVCVVMSHAVQTFIQNRYLLLAVPSRWATNKRPTAALCWLQSISIITKGLKCI